MTRRTSLRSLTLWKAISIKNLHCWQSSLVLLRKRLFRSLTEDRMVSTQLFASLQPLTGFLSTGATEPTRTTIWKPYLSFTVVTRLNWFTITFSSFVAMTLQRRQKCQWVCSPNFETLYLNNRILAVVHWKYNKNTAEFKRSWCCVTPNEVSILSCNFELKFSRTNKYLYLWDTLLYMDASSGVCRELHYWWYETRLYEIWQ